MKRILLSSIMLLLINVSMMAINMKVGNTETLNIGNINHLQGCQWTISRPNDVVFTTTPHSYSTQVTIKAVNSFPATSPCIVQCKYYYLELDPTTGRYIYSRTGYKDWTIFVSSNGSSGSGYSDDVSDNTISLSTTHASVRVDEWVDVSASSGSKLYWSIDNPNYAVFTSTKNNRISVRGICPGETRIRVQSEGGGYANCLLTILPKSSYTVGETITAPTAEGVFMQFRVTDLTEKTCELSKVPTDKVNKMTIPLEAHGFLVSKISSAAFWDTNVSVINIPQSVTYIDEYAFAFNHGLKELSLPDGVTHIGYKACYFTHDLETINIPSEVTSIGENAFVGTNMKSVYSYIKTPFEINENVFNFKSLGEGLTLYVPYGTKSLYQDTQGWNLFPNIIEMDMTQSIEFTKANNCTSPQIYTINGRLIQNNTSVNNLPNGIYIVNKKKIIKK